MSQAAQFICEGEIASLLQKKAIRIVERESPGLLSPFFAVAKKPNGWRPIINLRKLNAHLKLEHFKLENMEAARLLIRPGHWLAKVDLKDGYLTIPLNDSFKRFIRSAWKGVTYEFRCLPFGLASAPYVFTKI